MPEKGLHYLSAKRYFAYCKRRKTEIRQRNERIKNKIKKIGGANYEVLQKELSAPKKLHSKKY